MNRILIATDGSDGAWAAVAEGVELAEEVGADVLFVYARHDSALLGEPVYQHHLTEQFQRAREALGVAEAEAERHHVEHESLILEGDPARCVAEAGRVENVDLVVVG